MTGASILKKGSWTESNYKRLQSLLEGEAGLAVFDFDNTLIYQDLGEACMYYVALQGMIAGHEDEFWELLEKWGHLPVSIEALKQDYERFLEEEDEAAYARLLHRILSAYQSVYKNEGMEAAYRWSAILFAWQPITEWEKIARHVFAEEQELPLGTKVLPSGHKLPQGIRKYEEMASLISALRERNWTVKIVTASPKELIAAVIPEWGLAPGDVIGMKLDRTSEGVYLPRVLDPMPFEHGKIAILKEALGSEVTPDFAAGDSLGDIELLKQARLSVLIDRGYEVMRKAAHEHEHILLQPRFIEPLDHPSTTEISAFEPEHR